jgi:hypothetical protein
MGLAKWLNHKDTWRTETLLLRNRILANFLFFTVIGANLMTAIMAAWGYRDTSTSQDPVPGWLWPAVISSVFAFGMFYSAVVYTSRTLVWDQTLGSWLGFEILVHRPEDTNIPPKMRPSLEESKLDGTRCRLGLHVCMRLSDQEAED